MPIKTLTARTHSHAIHAHTISQSITIRGDDVALTPSYTIGVDVLRHDDYVGNGTIEVRIEDDDRKQKKLVCACVLTSSQTLSG